MIAHCAPDAPSGEPSRPADRPLLGRRIVVTQATHQAAELANLLSHQGAIPLLYPCIAIQPPADTTQLDEALLRAAEGDFDWMVVTSANTVRILAQRLAALDRSPQALSHTRIATVGAATAAAVHDLLGLEVALTPENEVAEGLADRLAAALHPGDRVFLPQAALARPVLARRLAAAGGAVTQIAAYETVRGEGGVDLPGLLARRAVDAVTLASSSAFHNLLARLQQEDGDPATLHPVCLACIGPVTAKTVREAGYAAAVVAEEQSLEGLVSALAHYFSQ